MDCGNAGNHIPEIPKPMINAIAPARIMMMLIMLWREKETGKKEGKAHIFSLMITIQVLNALVTLTLYWPKLCYRETFSFKGKWKDRFW